MKDISNILNGNARSQVQYSDNYLSLNQEEEMKLDPIKTIIDHCLIHWLVISNTRSRFFWFLLNRSYKVVVIKKSGQRVILCFECIWYFVKIIFILSTWYLLCIMWVVSCLSYNIRAVRSHFYPEENMLRLDFIVPNTLQNLLAKSFLFQQQKILLGRLDC